MIDVWLWIDYRTCLDYAVITDYVVQEWIVDCDQDEVDPEAQEEANGDDLGTHESGEGSSIRELLDEDFESESEEEVLEEVEYESDGVQIVEHCGD